MTDQMRPPPLPVNREETTEPGIGMSPEMLKLRGENNRLRRERNAARVELEKLSLGQSAGGSLPPPTRKQRAVGVSLALGKYASLLVLLPALGAAVAKAWPEYAGVVNVVIQALAP